MKLVQKWPESARIIKHAENSKNDMLYISNHTFPHLDPIWYCKRSWGPQEYVEYRVELLKKMYEDTKKIINLFEERGEISPDNNIAICDKGSIGELISRL